MNISNKSKETIEACRFCWMCRHLCPVGNVTGHERNTARARALSLSLVERGAEKLSDMIDNVYECSLCGACTADCITGWDPTQFALETRCEGALTGVLPEYIKKLVMNIFENGNVYGVEKIDKELLTLLKSNAKNSKTLLFLGEDAIYKSPKNAKNAIDLLMKANVDFATLENEPNSGASLYFLTGKTEETRQKFVDCAKILNEYESVIVYSEADAKAIKRDMKDCGVDIKSRVYTYVEMLALLIKEGKLKTKKSDKFYTPQDHYIYAREFVDNDSIRYILSSVGEVKEMLLNKKDTVLAGSLLMNEYMPHIIKEMAKRRIDDAKRMGCKNIVTESVSENELLKSVEQNEIEILSIEEVLL